MPKEKSFHSKVIRAVGYFSDGILNNLEREKKGPCPIGSAPGLNRPVEAHTST